MGLLIMGPILWGHSRVKRNQKISSRRQFLSPRAEAEFRARQHRQGKPSNAAELDIELHPRQFQAFSSEATELFYGGAAGGGKSYLMRCCAITWCSQIPGLQVYLFRRVREDLIKGHVEGTHGFQSMLAEWIAAGLAWFVGDEIRFWNNSVIWLCHCKDEKDRFKYLSADIHVLLVDELTTFSSTIYYFLRSRVRATGLEIPEEYKGRFPRIICASNPGNVGHLWVKADFIDNHAPNEIWRTPDNLGGMLRQFIPARLEDNPSLNEEDPTYRQRLRGLGNEALVKAMEEGDWNVVAGAFFDCWSTSVHVVPVFTPPLTWTRIMGFDWGSAKPYCALWTTVADGNPVRTKGGFLTFPKNSLVVYRELYGAKSPNVGLKQTAEQCAEAIALTEGQDKPHTRIADPACWKQDGGPSIAERMARPPSKIMMRRGDNSRVSGWDQVRNRLLGDLDPEGMSVPMMYFTEACRNTIRTLPALQHDSTVQEDLDSDGEDHAADTVRYICMSRPYTRTTTDASSPIRGLSGMTMDELWDWQSRTNKKGSMVEKRI